jgi:sortase A
VSQAGERGSGRTRWRVLLGVVGELLVVLGVLLGLFVVWQVWWTDVEVRSSLSERLARVEGSAEPVGAAPAPTTAAAPIPRRTPPPVLPPPEPLGTTFASLRVPAWGAEYAVPISEGVDRAVVLDRLGVGHYPRTAMPGGQGNFALAGHRVGFGRPFSRIADLVPGDALVVRTRDTWYVYLVTTSHVVPPTEVDVVAPVPGQPDAEPTTAAITLTTCHPLFSVRERFVVHGVLDYWLPASGPPPVEVTAPLAPAAPVG